MNETLFYVLGIGLVVVAVLVAVIGLRFEKFPASKGVLVLGTAAFAALVVATGAFAWWEWSAQRSSSASRRRWPSGACSRTLESTGASRSSYRRRSGCPRCPSSPRASRRRRHTRGRGT